MSLYFHGTEIEDAYYHGTKLDYIYYHGTMVYEATIYVPKPTLSGAFTFDNTAKAPTITNYDSSAMIQSGTTSATAAGTYTITYTLRAGYAWQDETTAPVTLTWSIAKRVLSVPTLTNTSYTWAVSRTFAPTVNGFNSTYETQSGTASSTNAGSYSVSWALRYPASTQWADGTTGTKSASWSVAKLKLTKPSLSGTTSFAFIEGTTRSVSVANFNSTYETQSGTTSTAAQGSYTITWALRYNTNTTWTDGTTANVTASWSITWVNGTSHYLSDLYNKGWYSANSLEFQYGVTWDSDCISINNPGGGTSINTSAAYGGTFHAVVYKASGDVRLVEVAANSYAPRTIATITAPNWQEVSGTHITSDFPRFGISAGASYKVQRIWIT